MKKLILSFIVALTVGAAMANDPTSKTGTALIKNGSVVKLFYKGTTQATVKVSILNERGALVFTETVRNTDGFSRPYNFSDLQYGAYTVEVDNGVSRNIEHVDYSTQGIVKFATVIKLKDENRYMLLVPNKSSEKLHITVLDSEGNKVHSSVRRLSGDFGTILNVEELNGPFTVLVEDSTGSMKSFSY